MITKRLSTRSRIAIVAAAMVAMPLASTAAAPSAEAGVNVGGCEILSHTLDASGSVSGGEVYLSGTRTLPRFGRDTRTHVTIRGVPIRDIGPARQYRAPRGTVPGTIVAVHFDRTYGLRDYTCLFRLARG